MQFEGPTIRLSLLLPPKPKPTALVERQKREKEPQTHLSGRSYFVSASCPSSPILYFSSLNQWEAKACR
ncbi:hypothetical protein K2173_012836 [Erythroxylum novogranatense]|uniref:Uncharacterized protein n=1 Tax=Erythroxylum novogranatense TaxID=1862640 RepID=A0AAV8UCI1_9ROSI|nr:hypothetical protein K2173_012836 [Erythroxylum novogranatense]